MIYIHVLVRISSRSIINSYNDAAHKEREIDRPIRKR